MKCKTGLDFTHKVFLDCENCGHKVVFVRVSRKADWKCRSKVWWKLQSLPMNCSQKVLCKKEKRLIGFHVDLRYTFKKMYSVTNNLKSLHLWTSEVPLWSFWVSAVSSVHAYLCQSASTGRSPQGWCSIVCGRRFDSVEPGALSRNHLDVPLVREESRWFKKLTTHLGPHSWLAWDRPVNECEYDSPNVSVNDLMNIRTNILLNSNSPVNEHMNIQLQNLFEE